MKTGSVIIIAIAFIAVGIGAYLLGRHRPSTDLQSEIAGLKTLAVSQEETISRMDSTIQSYDTAIKVFVLNFDQFKLDNSAALKQMERNAVKGREFQRTQIEKLAELNKRRDELAEEAKIFEY